MTNKKTRSGSVGLSSVLPIAPGRSVVSPTLTNLPHLKEQPSAEMLKQLSKLTSHDSISSLSTLRRLSTGQSDSWRDEFRRDGVFKRAFWAILLVLRNVCICILYAVLLNYLCSVGTLSTKPVSEQSRTLYLLATMFWIHLFLCTTVFVAQASFLVGHRFSAHPDRPATLLSCLQRLCSKTYASYFVSLALHLGTVYWIATCLPIEMRKYRLEFYLGGFSSHIFTANVVVSTRQVFQRETIAGLKHKNRDASDAKGLGGRARYFAKVYVRYSAALLSMACAGFFVHATHHYHVVSHGDLWLTVGGCIAFKFLLQEATKTCVFNQKMSDIRFMWVAIGAPTVVIDTQMRIALQRSDSLQLLLTGFAIMGLTDVAMRAAKVALVKLEIRHAKEQSYPTTVSGAIRQYRLEQARHASGQLRRSKTPANALQRQKQRLLSLHTAETYAGMAAQYIAIGCSTSLLYFFWDHAKYELRMTGDPYRTDLSVDVDKELHAINSPWSRSALLVAQLGVEIAVGYLTSLLEIGAGIDFDELRRYGPSVLAMLLCLAIINMQISVIILMRIT